MANSQAQNFLQQIYQQIEENISQKKFAEAHTICLQTLRLDPENIKLIRFKNTIEALVREKNRVLIKQDLERLEPLWKEEKYEEILIHLKTLEPFIKDYPKLKKIIIKAQNNYNKKFLQEKTKYYQNELEKIGTLCKEKQFSDALRKAENLYFIANKEREIKKLLQNIRSQWIQEEIKNHQALLKSEKFEEILLFYQKLKKISPEIKLDKTIEKTKKAQKKHEVFKKREFIYQGLENIKTLLQLKKYEKALKGAEEILNIDPENKKAKKIYKKAFQKNEQTVENEVISQIQNQQRQLKSKLITNKEGFRKI